MFKRTEKQSEALRLFSCGAHHILLFGGSRSGKTFITVYAVILRALKAPGSRHVIIRRHFIDVRQSIGMDTFGKVMSLRFPEVKYEVNRSDWFIRLPNGSEIWLAGLDDQDRADKILGKEYATIYFNECSQLDCNSIQTALTRLAQNCPGIINKAFYDCNPSSKSHWSYLQFVKKQNPADNRPLKNPENYVAMLMNPVDNAANLPDGYIDDTLAGLAERPQARFLRGEWLDDIEGALWTRAMIAENRSNEAPAMQRIVIAIDPAVTAKESSDETGIVAAGADRNGHYYVLGDYTLKSAPAVWADAAIREYRRWKADRIIGEVNNGGDLVESVIRSVDRNVSFSAVRASRGKIVRAEPIAALYEKGRVHHCGYFPELEDQMCGYTGKDDEKSPDRMDAMVWALTELSERAGGSRILVTG